PGDIGHFIEKETGIDRGGEDTALIKTNEAAVQISQQPNVWVPAFHAAWNENAPHTFDYLIRPQSSPLILQIYNCGDGNESDGVISINGREVYRTSNRLGCNFVRGNPPELFEVNLTPYVGRDVLISIAFDDGADNNTNADQRYFSSPR